MGAELNLTGVQWEATRRVVDPAIRRVVDSLEVAYYNNWRQGKNFLWHGFDARATPAQSKQQFDILHGALWHLHALMLLEKDAGVVDRTKLDPMVVAAKSYLQGLPRATRDALVAAVKAEGYQLKDV